MHLTPQSLAAVGASPWMIPNPLLRNFAIGLGLTFGVTANLTVSVQHTFDDPAQNPRAVALARAGTVLTITDNGHNLNVGDNTILSNPGSDPNNTFAGSYDVATVVDANNYTVTVPNAGAAAAGGALQSFRVFNHATLNGVTGAPPVRADGNYAYPIGAFRLKCTAWTAGTATLTGQQGMGG